MKGAYLINWPGTRWGQVESLIVAGIDTLINVVEDLPGLAPVHQYGQYHEFADAIDRFGQHKNVDMYLSPVMFRHHRGVEGVTNQFFDGVKRLPHTPCPRSHEFLQQRLGHCAQLVRDNRLAGIIIDVEPYAYDDQVPLPVYSRPAGTYQCHCREKGCNTRTAAQQWADHVQIARGILAGVPTFGQMTSMEKWVQGMGPGKPIAGYERAYTRLSKWPCSRARKDIKTLSDDGWQAVPGVWTDKLDPNAILDLYKRQHKMSGSAGSWLYAQTSFSPGATFGQLPDEIDRRPIGVRDPKFYDKLAKLHSRL